MAAAYEPSYEMVLEPGNLVWTMVGYGAHGAMLGMQVFLALFLLIGGLLVLVRPDSAPQWMRRLGATRVGTPDARGIGFLKVVLGVLLLLPALLRAPWPVSLLASLGALGLLLWLEWGVPEAWKSTGRILRVVSIAAAASVSAFMLFETDDGIALGGRVLFKMSEWRTNELDWQLANDPRSPKVGDLAPDFELADPTGTHTTRLSDYRGKRPVALVFGSYT